MTRLRRWSSHVVGYAAALFGIGLFRWLFGPDDAGKAWSAALAVVAGMVLVGTLSVAVISRVQQRRRRT